MAFNSGLTVSARKTSHSGDWRCGLIGGSVILWRALQFQKAWVIPVGWDPGMNKKGESSWALTHTSLFFPTLAAMWPAASTYAIMLPCQDEPWNYKQQQTPFLKFLCQEFDHINNKKIQQHLLPLWEKCIMKHISTFNKKRYGTKQSKKKNLCIYLWTYHMCVQLCACDQAPNRDRQRDRASPEGAANLTDLLSGPWILSSKFGEAKNILKMGMSHHTEEKSMTSGFPQSLSAAWWCHFTASASMWYEVHSSHFSIC